jgi:hypothetical protein
MRAGKVRAALRRVLRVTIDDTEERDGVGATLGTSGSGSLLPW